MDEIMLAPAFPEGEGETMEKKKEDLSGAADIKIPEAQSLAESGNLSGAIESLLVFEKQTRVAADAVSSSRILVCIVELCFKANELKLLQEHVVLLCKRRGQLKAAVTAMVEKCCEFVEQIADLEQKIEYIKVLREVTDGKIYVEIYRARLTMTLAMIKEGQGEITEAADILQELQVETFGSMPKKEKVEFILEQIRLCLAKKDFIRTGIISKKISSRTLEHADYQQEKLRYYTLLVELAQHENSHIEICKHHLAMANTACVKENEEQLREHYRQAVAYLCLASYDNEQSDLVHRLYENKLLESIPAFKELLKSFILKEVLEWDTFSSIFSPELIKANCFTSDFEKQMGIMKLRVVEHNIRVISFYYTRISCKRMNELIGLPAEEAEKSISDLVVSKMIYAKIDRPAGIITFTKTLEPNDRLNEWANNIGQLMSLVENSTHLINLARTDAAIAKVRV